MKLNYKFSGFVVAAGLWWTLAPFAQAKTNLSCTIVDEKGAPIAKQDVVLEKGGKEAKKGKTDDKGVVEFKGVDDGTYTINGSVQGSISSGAPIEVAGSAPSCNHMFVTTAYANSLLQDTLDLVKQRKYPEAEEKGKKAVEIMPDQSGSYYVLSLAYAYQGKEDDAVKAVKKAAELTPDKYAKVVPTVQVAAMDVEAKQLAAKKDVPGMQAEYDKMLAISDDKATVYYNMAIAYGNMRNFTEALKDIDKAIELAPQDAQLQQAKVALQDSYLKSMNQQLEKK